jgi:hypothetical protein
MNIPDSLLLSFHDAHQDFSPASGLHATPPASADAVSTPVEDTPIRQQRFFPEANNCKSNNDNNNEEVEHTCQRNGAWLLGRIQNQSLDIDMNLVKKEAEEEGDDSDSKCCQIG